ncbi:MAG: hypothetical protein HOQ44_18170 [Nocardia sp.]|nr:hypothetical protein [Nocardia sp.]
MLMLSLVVKAFSGESVLWALSSDDTAKGSADMNSGSAAALEGIRQGYLNGDPVATALFIPLFFIAGAFALLQGQSF